MAASRTSARQNAAGAVDECDFLHNGVAVDRFCARLPARYDKRLTSTFDASKTLRYKMVAGLRQCADDVLNSYW